LRKKIKKYFEEHHGEYFTAADIADAFSMEFLEADEICEKLLADGEVKANET